MTNSQKIKMALAYIGMSESELARRLNTSPQAFGQRMKNDKFSTQELSNIAKAIGAEYQFYFQFEDGTKV